jgi:hypothetical protein
VISMFVGLALAAAWANWGSGLQALAVINAIAAFWSNGVLANFRGDPHGAPNWAAAASIISAVAAVVLLLVAWLM